MKGDPRNQNKSLLQKYDIPIDHIDYDYVRKCTNHKELEKIVRILRSGEEGHFPDLLKVTEECLRVLAPESRLLREELPVLNKDTMSPEVWKEVESDLQSWATEMSMIDKSLDFEKSRVEFVGNKNLPDVRKVTKTPGSKPIPKSRKCYSNAKNERIKSGDYASWEKFDVDKELLKLDVEQERKEEENKRKKKEMKKVETEKKVEIDVDKESYSSTEQQIFAAQAKDRGNECFKSGDLENALKYYNVSIKLYATANAYNNMAMTYLKLKQYDKAIEYCNIVLNMEKNNVKALHRRATAYQNLTDSDIQGDMLALKDLYQVVNLEPNNKAAQLDLQKLKNKLGIQDTGKKFRMAIQESDTGSVKENGSTGVKTQEAIAAKKDVPKNVDKLPLTYYGPSTSSFECEPFSLAHHALSGSLLPTGVMCKCNSNRPKQNPLCQKCGEAISTPKPQPKSKLSKIEFESTSKAQNDAKNTLQKLESNAVENDNIFAKGDFTKANKEIQNVCSVNKVSTEVGPEVKKKEIPDSVVSYLARNKTTKEKSESDSDKINNYNVTPKSNVQKPSVKASEKSEGDAVPCKLEKVKSKKTFEKISEPHVNANPVPSAIAPVVTELKTGEGFGGSEVMESSTVNSKTKKKKSKKNRKKNMSLQEQLEKMEPIKVVHAAKYLKSTSVEPKVKAEVTAKKEEKEANLGGGNQFNPFVPNRQCLSLRRENSPTGNRLNLPVRKSAASPGQSAKPVPSKLEEVESLEGNKENLLKMTNSKGIVEKSMVKSEATAAEKPEDSCIMSFTPHQFVCLWNHWQKGDADYAKRARLIRSIEPSQLGEIIGVKLDSDMLKTFLECLEKHFVDSEPKLVIDFLKQLPRIDRFDLIKMFLAESDRNVMRNLIAAVENKGFPVDEDIKKGLAIS